ncbi:MAG TPA: hypothetical protein VI814_07700 [Candidatus Limnocylindria bacterium]
MSDVLARREAVARICEDAATSVVDRVVREASAAANVFGLSSERATRYGDGIKATLPVAFEAMCMPDGPARDARIADVARLVRAVTDTHHIPRIVERGLVAIAYRITREVIRRRASQTAFGPDELESEFVAFGEQLEARLFSD